MAVPTQDLLLAPYSINVNTRIVASPSTYSLTSAQAAEYTARHNPYIAAWNAVVQAREAGNRSENLTAVKDAAKKVLLPYARELYAFIQSSVTVTDADKILLGITVRKTPTPIPVPEIIPTIKIKSVVQNIVTILIQDNDESRKGLPPLTSGAMVHTFIGALPPDDVTAWKSEGLTSRAELRLQFPLSAGPFAKVWITAQYVNRKGQTSLACTPISTNLGTWLVQQAA